MEFERNTLGRVLIIVPLLLALLPFGTCAITLSVSRGDGTQPTQVQLRCFDGSFPLHDPTFTVIERPFQSGERETTITDGLIDSQQYNFNVTPETEVRASCTVGGETSPLVDIAARPLYDGPMREPLEVSVDDTAQLTCPFRFGLLSQRLDPYNITWHRRENGRFIDLATDNVSRGYSLEGSTLLLPITVHSHSKVYQCRARVKLCSSGDCDTVGREGPLTRLIVFGFTKSKPRPQTVTKDESATFTCTAKGGGNLSIAWTYDSETYEDATSRTYEDGVNVTVARVPSTGSVEEVKSAITIPSSLIPESEQLVYCEVSQTVNGMTTTERFNASLSRCEDCDTTSVGSTDPPSLRPTTPPREDAPPAFPLSTIIAVAVASAIIVIAVTIVIVLCVCCCKYKSEAVKRIPRSIRRTVSGDPNRNSHRSGVQGQGNNSHNTPDAGRKNGDALYADPDVLSPSLFKGVNVAPERQIGVPYDIHCVKGTDPYAAAENGHGRDPTTQELIYNNSQGGASGVSAYSGLSGVSQNPPGPHPMPNLFPTVPESATNLSQSETNSGLLCPPGNNWEQMPHRKISDTSINSARTRSTSVHSGSQPRDGGLYPPYIPSAIHGSHEFGPGYPQPNQFAQYPHSSDGYYPQQVQQEYPQFREYNVQRQYSASQPHLAFKQQTPYNLQGRHSPARMHNSPHLQSSPKLSGPSQIRSQAISQEALLMVMNCLMHNKNCQIPHCPCRQVQENFSHLFASCTPLDTPERHRRHRRFEADSGSVDDNNDSQDPVVFEAQNSSSQEDSPNESLRRRLDLRLKIPDEIPPNSSDSNIHPHYHLTTKSYLRRVQPRYSHHTRSKSLSDLTPLTELPETPATTCQTPKVGGFIIAGTPIRCPGTLGDSDSSQDSPTGEFNPNPKPPALLREISISADNLPALCLNDCPLTPSPLKSAHRSLGGLASSPMKQKRRHSSYSSKSKSNRPSLKTVQENSLSLETDGSNTSSRSPSPSDTVRSDIDDGIEADSRPEDSILSEIYKPTQFQNGHSRTISRGESSGYESSGDPNSGNNSQCNSGSMPRKGGQPTTSSLTSSVFSSLAKSKLTSFEHKHETNALYSTSPSHTGVQLSKLPHSRSPSPYQTDSISVNGTTTMITEC